MGRDGAHRRVGGRVSGLVHRRHSAGGITSHATFSPCGAFRYALTRCWAPGSPRLAFVLLNPSTATEAADDPTIARCVRRARDGGFGAVRIVNLFAFRAIRPAELRAAADPVGPQADAAIATAARWADLIVCGWGNHGALQGRGPAVAAVLRRAGHRLHHLGLTQAGHPMHPLYRPLAEGPRPWRAQAARGGQPGTSWTEDAGTPAAP